MSMADFICKEERIINNVWITGVGQYSSLGKGYQAFREALLAGWHGMQTLDITPAFGEGLGAPIADNDRLKNVQTRLKNLLRPTLEEALQDAKLPGPQALDLDMPVVVATNFGNHLDWLDHKDFLHPIRTIMQELKIAGEVWGISTACASGANAIGLGMDLIRYDEVPQVLVCGYDLISDYNYAGLASLKALSPDKIRPFDKKRQGTLLGEGVGVMLLESETSCRQRQHKPYAAVLGYGTANDGYHFTAPEPSGLGMRHAMQQALSDANCTPDMIDHINAHGTGTDKNDKIETAAIREIFAEQADQIPITSTKPAIGHTMGGAGVLEAIAALVSLLSQRIPPTLNLNEVAPECDLDYVMEPARTHDMHKVVSNSYGLWGCNASVVLSLVDEETR